MRRSKNGYKSTKTTNKGVNDIHDYVKGTWNVKTQNVKSDQFNNKMTFLSAGSRNKTVRLSKVK